MNQILSVYNSSTYKNIIISYRRKYKKLYIIQFSCSTLLLLILVILLLNHIIHLSNKEKLSDSIIENYNLSQLYSDNNVNINTKKSNNSVQNKYNIFGTINIPAINIYYPVFNNLNDELLKISPCLVTIETIDDTSNIVIAGHNYENNMFFSNLKNLNINDLIFIEIDSIISEYSVYNIFEVNENDLEVLSNTYNNEITLITCNNSNSNRLIIKAIKNP